MRQFTTLMKNYKEKKSELQDRQIIILLLTLIKTNVFTIIYIIYHKNIVWSETVSAW